MSPPNCAKKVMEFRHLKSDAFELQIIRVVAFSQILRMAFDENGISQRRPHSSFGEVWHTSTTTFDNLPTFQTIFAAETTGFGLVDWESLGLLGLKTRLID